MGTVAVVPGEPRLANPRILDKVGRVQRKLRPGQRGNVVGPRRVHVPGAVVAASLQL